MKRVEGVPRSQDLFIQNMSLIYQMKAKAQTKMHTRPKFLFFVIFGVWEGINLAKNLYEIFFSKKNKVPFSVKNLIFLESLITYLMGNGKKMVKNVVFIIFMWFLATSISRLFCQSGGQQNFLENFENLFSQL